MRVTKYEHACLDIELKGKRLIVDPGKFTVSLSNFDNICAVIITHKHTDHLDLDLLDKILSANPDTQVYTVKDASEDLGNRPYEIVTANESMLCDVFHVSFFGGEHAVIHPDIQPINNVGVLINNTIYYPGDSLISPDVNVDTLALPAVAPWMKISETIEFLKSVKPSRVFPTHNALLSKNGEEIYHGMIEKTADNIGSSYIHLQPGQSLDT